MVVYEGFGHGVNKPRQEAWFSRYIWGEPLPKALRPDTPDLKVEETGPDTPPAKPTETARPTASD